MTTAFRPEVLSGLLSVVEEAFDVKEKEWKDCEDEVIRNSKRGLLSGLERGCFPHGEGMCKKCLNALNAKKLPSDAATGECWAGHVPAYIYLIFSYLTPISLLSLSI